MAETTIVILPDGRMDTANAAEYLGMSVDHLLRLKASGKGPEWVQPGGTGGKVFYYQHDLDEWLKSDPS